MSEQQGREPNYRAAVDERCKEIAETRKPGLYEATVYHDYWCDLLKDGVRGSCNCNPILGPSRAYQS